MAELTHYFESNVTEQSHTGNTLWTEVSALTVAWADLTGAGFANGDNIVVMVRASLSVDSGTDNAAINFKQGTSTFDVATQLDNHRVETDGSKANDSSEFFYIQNITLSTDDTFFTGIRTLDAVTTAFIKDWEVFFLSLDELDADDYRWNENTTVTQGTTSDQDGASVTLPASGGDDWLIVSSIKWDIADVTVNSQHKLSLDATDYMKAQFEGEDTAEVHTYGMIGYLGSAANSAVCKAVFTNSSTGINDHGRSAVFALRLEAFVDHIGNYNSTPVAISGTNNTFVQTNTASLGLTSNGNVCYFSQTIADIASKVVGHSPRHRVQADGTDIVTGFTTYGHNANENDSQIGLSSFGVKSLTAGTIVIDTDCTNNVGSSTTYNFDEHTLVAFSLELAGAGGATTPKGPLGLPFNGPFGGPL